MRTDILLETLSSLLNNFFTAQGSSALASIVSGNIHFELDHTKFSYPVNLRISLGEFDTYFYIGEYTTSPFWMDLSALKDLTQPRKFLIKELEKVASWQAARQQKDLVIFEFVPKHKLQKSSVSVQAVNPATLRQKPKPKLSAGGGGTLSESQVKLADTKRNPALERPSHKS